MAPDRSRCLSLTFSQTAACPVGVCAGGWAHTSLKDWEDLFLECLREDYPPLRPQSLGSHAVRLNPAALPTRKLLVDLTPEPPPDEPYTFARPARTPCGSGCSCLASTLPGAPSLGPSRQEAELSLGGNSSAPTSPLAV